MNGWSGADVLVCNILAPVIMQLAPDFAQLMKTTRGQGWLSGLLTSQLAATQQNWTLPTLTSWTHP